MKAPKPEPVLPSGKKGDIRGLKTTESSRAVKEPKATPLERPRAKVVPYLRQQLEALELVLLARPLACISQNYHLASRANASNGFSHKARAAKARLVKEQREVGGWLALGLRNHFIDWNEPGMVPVDFFAVRLVRIAPRTLDPDNLASAFKAIVDAIADTFGIDDRDPRVRYVVDQAKGPAAVEAYLYARRSE